MTGNHHSLAERNRLDFGSTSDLRSLWKRKTVFKTHNIEMFHEVFSFESFSRNQWQELSVIKINFLQKYMIVTINSI